MNYITPEEVLTHLPNEIRQGESKEELVTYVIRGYQQLDIPQDKDYQQDVVQTTDSHKVTIPANYKYIHSVSLLDDCPECIAKLQTVYPTNIRSNYCKDDNVCKDCVLRYSIDENILTLPLQYSTYAIYFTSLFSDELKVYNDPTVIAYLASYATYQVVFNRSLTNDISQNMLSYVESQMNFLYQKARGQAVMKSIKLSNQKLNINPTTLTIDEFSNRH